jgi:hypothetical protein
MEKTSTSPVPSTDFVEHVEPITQSNIKPSLVRANIEQEHQLTFRDVWENHRSIVGWSFFWAMCAIGWFEILSYTVVLSG